MPLAPLVTSWTPETLAARLRKTAERDKVEDALEAALGLLTQKLEQRWRDVPTSVYDVMVLRVARAVFEGDGRQFTDAAPTQIGAGSGGGAKPGRDPLEPVAGLLRAYLVPFA